MAEKLALFKSSGRDEASYGALLDVLPKTQSALNVCLIPTASNVEYEKGIIPGTLATLRKLGLSNIDEFDIARKEEAEVRHHLRDADIVFVAGGNPYYLLHHMQLSGFKNVIHEMINEGVVYIGASAGSTVAGPTIRTSSSEDVVNLVDQSGLGIIPFSVVSHYIPEKHNEFERRTRLVNEPVVAIPDTQAILLQGEEYRLVGVGDVATFKGFDISL